MTPEPDILLRLRYFSFVINVGLFEVWVADAINVVGFVDFASFSIFCFYL